MKVTQNQTLTLWDTARMTPTTSAVITKMALSGVIYQVQTHKS